MGGTKSAMALKETKSNEEPCAGARQVYIELLPSHKSPVIAQKL